MIFSSSFAGISKMQSLKSNNKIAEQIKKMQNSGRMGHAFLFVGGSRESREEIGLWLASEVLCKTDIDRQKFEHGNHEDLISVEKPDDRETIVVSVIEEMTEKLRFKPFGSCYAVIIKDAHLMRQEAQNKLLKTLEEPVTEAVIILLAERLDAILPTVQSRCNAYILEDVASDAGDAAKATAEVFLRQVRMGAPYYRKKAVLADIINDKDNGREKALEFLDVFEEKLEMELLGGAEDTEVLSRALKQAETGRKYLKQVHSVAYTLKQFCLRV